MNIKSPAYGGFEREEDHVNGNWRKGIIVTWSRFVGKETR
jgi:hypothetical protein